MISDKDLSFFERRSEQAIDLCGWLAPILNELHGLNFSTKFWSRILASYALSVINQKPYFEKEKFEYPICFEPINGWAPASRTAVVKGRILSTLRSLKGKYPTRGVLVVAMNSERLALGPRAATFSRELDAAPLSFNCASTLKYPNRKARSYLSSIARSQDCTFHTNVIRSIPKIYAEYFGTLLNSLRKFDGTSVNEILVEHYGSPSEEILAAYLSEVKQARISQLQQGGFVGETKLSILPIARVKYDRLLTYGWQINKEDHPFFAVRLEEYRARYNSCLTDRNSIDALFVYGAPPNSTSLEQHYTAVTTTILSELDRRRFKNILLRPRATSRRLGLVEFPKVFSKVGNDQLDTGRKPIHELCASARIVVQVMMPSTNFLECIFVDQPVVSIDTNSMPTEVIAPFIDFFHAKGVLHKDATSLIGFLNRVNIRAWWSDVISDPIYAEFKKTFARSRVQYLECRGY